MNKKIFLILPAILILAVFLFMRGDNSAGDRLVSLEGLERLTELDAELNATFGSDLSKLTDGERKEALQSLNTYVKSLQKESKEHLSLAKKVDLEDQVAMENFLMRHNEITNIAGTGSQCDRALRNAETQLSNPEVKSSFRKTVMQGMEDACEVSHALDTVTIKRTKEPIKVPNEYSEVESASIPAGYTFVALRPTDGEKDLVTITVADKERGPAEVVTLAPVYGKKVTGTGNSEQIASSVAEILEEILTLWKTQAFNKETVAKYLETHSQNNAEQYEKRYTEIAFNWMRFKTVKPDVSRVSYKDTSGNIQRTVLGSVLHPFTMSLPLSMETALPFANSVIPFYYYPETDSWGAGKDTIDVLINLVRMSYIPASFAPETLFFAEHPDCRDRGRFMRASGMKLTDARLEGYSTLKLSTTNGTPTNFFVRMPGRDTLVELRSSGELTPELIAHINSNRLETLTIAEMSEIWQKACKITQDLTISFTNGDES